MRRVRDLLIRARDFLRTQAIAGGVAMFLGHAPVSFRQQKFNRFGGTFYSGPYAAFKKSMLPVVRSLSAEKTDGPVAIVVECVMERARTSKLSVPRGDVDNLGKGPLDLINDAKNIWEDDKQVVFAVFAKRFAEAGESPGYHVTTYPLDPNACLP